jgi:MFS family permease
VRWTAYFAALGLAYLLVEVALMQKFILYLGHPTYALAVVLFTLLLSSGVGAALSEWIPADKVEGRLRVVMGVLAFAAAALMVAAPRLFHETLAWPLLSRALVSAAAIAPLGIMMGMPFPLGVRLVSYDHPRGVGWMYAVNSAASVFGSVAAMLIALHWGFSAAVAAGLALYVVAAFIP